MASLKCVLRLAAPETGHNCTDSIDSTDTPQKQTERKMGEGRAGSPQSASKDLSID